MKKKLVFALVVMGASGILAQILLLRELLVSFYGNELSIGIILANWLILEAFGSYFLGKRIEGATKRLEAYVGLQLLFSFFLPIAIYSTRILKVIIGVTPGEALGLLPMLYSSFLILLPVSIPHGTLFTFGCKLYSSISKEDAASISKEDAASISKVYIYETIGTMMGGILLTYLLIPYLHSFQIALGVGLINIALCWWLLWPFTKKALTTKALGYISVATSLLFAWLTFGPPADQIHSLSTAQQWPGQKVLLCQNSIYGNVAVTKKGEQFTFFSNGIPTITTPVPDITFVEEFAHLPLLAHPAPRKVLIISGGAGGLIHEVLKHPIERIDYTELDPLIIQMVERFPTPLTAGELSDRRVNIKYTDGRLFLKKTPTRYDLILIGLSFPSDLQVNRLFTREFFSLTRERMNEGGILVISLPGSLTYLSGELRKLNACIITTLERIYPYIKIIPGDFNLFLASSSPELASVTATQLSQALKERALEVSLLTPGHIRYRLAPRWLEWFLTSIKDTPKKTNEDFLPLGVFYSLSHWNALFSPYMRATFRWFERANLWIFIIPLSILTSLFLLGRLKASKLSRAVIPICITTTGFAGMIFNLALIFTFQSLYGYVYYQVGLLVTALMVGIAAGSLLVLRSLDRIKNDLATFRKLEAAIILFSAVLPAVFLTLHPYLGRPVVFLLLQIIFLLLSFLSGVLIGAEFPLANKIVLSVSPSLSGTAGLLYGVDLLGGWMGGILGGVILLPVLGLLKTCGVVVALKLASLLGTVPLGVTSRKT